jgi:hypothetical protein
MQPEISEIKIVEVNIIILLRCNVFIVLYFESEETLKKWAGVKWDGYIAIRIHASVSAQQ